MWLARDANKHAWHLCGYPTAQRDTLYISHAFPVKWHNSRTFHGRKGKRRNSDHTVYCGHSVPSRDIQSVHVAAQSLL